MGNSASSSRGVGSSSLQDGSNNAEGNNKDIVFGEATSPSSSATNFSPKAGSQRRIVKAVKPTGTTLETLSVPESNDGATTEEEVPQENGKAGGEQRHSSLKRNSKSRNHLDIVTGQTSSPSMALETLEEQKQERLDSMRSSQRSRREKRLEDRRKNGNSKSTPTNAAKFQANPFSKFLSVFSVDSHPEHKRSYEVSEADDDLGPSEKKPRAAEGDDRLAAAATFPSLLGSSWFASATAVAVLAIAAGIFLRASKLSK